MAIDGGIYFSTDYRVKHSSTTKKETLPDKVNINGAHGASEDYPIPPLGVVNSLIDDGKGEWKISYMNRYLFQKSSTIKLPHQGLELLKWFHGEL